MIFAFRFALILFFVQSSSAFFPVHAAQPEPEVSPFEIHGIVEGFYGRQWTHPERLDMIRFMGEFGLKDYVYAPKDDPLHRQRWREPYSGEALDQFNALIEVSEKSDVNLYYAISPGLSIIYTDEDDYQALIDKLRSMHDLGVRHFALFLDDVPETLNHAADKEVFDNLGEAHVHLINRLYTDLRQMGSNLIVCPTTYTDAWGDRGYVEIIGKGVPEEIPLSWTGVDVAVGEITKEQAEFWGSLMSRHPLIWDNYPVNDFETWRPFLGPLSGRTSDLHKAASGILSNPMNQPYASMIPLATVAYYVHDPENYDSDAAIERALVDLYGEKKAGMIRPIVEIYADYGWEDNVFTSLWTPGKPFHVPTIRENLEVFEESLKSLASLSDKGDRLEGFISEMKPFLENTTETFNEFLDNPAYKLQEDGHLVYREDWEVITARQAPFMITVDGSLEDWKHEAFNKIYSAHPEAVLRPLEASFLWDDEYLHAGIRVYTDTVIRRDPVINGDHLILAIDGNPESDKTWLKPGDLLVIMQPPKGGYSPEPLLKSMQMEPFAQRGISDITLYTLTSFFFHSATTPPESLQDVAARVQFASAETENGYSYHIAVPHQGSKEIRLNIGGLLHATHGETLQPNRFTLSQRSMFGNTFTFPRVLLRE